MKKLASLLALLVCMAGTANAQGGMNLGSADCWTGANGSASNACTSNTGSAMSLFVTVQSPNDITNFNNVEIVIDVETTASPLPAWWQLASGGCRAGAASAATITGGANCADIWGGDAIGVLAFAPPSNPNRIRLLPVVGSPTEYPVGPADGELAVMKVTISRTKSTGTGNCAGCLVGACIVLNSVKVGQPAGFGDTVVLNPIENQHVSYNGGTGANCPGATPTQSKTWGAVKALYR